jgi:hypothetical protein
MRQSLRTTGAFGWKQGRWSFRPCLAEFRKLRVDAKVEARLNQDESSFNYRLDEN